MLRLYASIHLVSGVYSPRRMVGRTWSIVMSQVIIIAGMHRSGTSLVASLLQKGGVNIGEKLLGASRGNLRGHFEDADFYEFQEKVLRERGLTFLVTKEFVFEPSPVEIEEARELIRRREGRPLWGWKDPRTSLFLDFWHRLLPNALFLFVFRHPLEVLFSLMRRGDLENLGLEGMESWFVYNRMIRHFVEQHRESTLLCHAYGVTDQFEDFGRLVMGKLALDLHLDASVLESLYHPEELKRVDLTGDVESALRVIHPEAMALYEHLNAIADLPFDPRQETSQFSLEMSRFAEYVSEFGSLHDSSRRSLLLLQASLLYPELSEVFFQEHSRNVAQLLKQVAMVEANRDQILDTLKQREDHLSDLTNRINLLWQQQAELQSDREKVERQLRLQGDQLRAQGDQLRAQGDQLRAQGDQLRAQGDQIGTQERQLRLLNEQLSEKTQQVERLLAENSQLLDNCAAQVVRADCLEAELQSVVRDLDALRRTHTVRISRAVGIAASRLLNRSS